MVIALAFFKRIFTRSLPTNQAHGLIIAEVCVSVVNEPGLSTPTPAHLLGAEIRSHRQNFRPCRGGPSRPTTTRARGRSSESVARRSRVSREPASALGARCNSSRMDVAARSTRFAVAPDSLAVDVSLEVVGEPSIPAAQLTHEPCRPAFRPLAHSLHQQGDVEDQNRERRRRQGWEPVRHCGRA
jgi:hypothetical protein